MKTGGTKVPLSKPNNNINKDKEKLSTKEIVSMCKSLAGKFRSPSHKDDLVQEGIITCYTILDTEPDAHPAKLYREAKRRMHDYLNLDTHPLTIPAHSASRRLTHNIDSDNSGNNLSDGSYEWLRTVLSTTFADYDEVSEMSGQVDNNDPDYLFTVAKGTLDQEEYQVIWYRYHESMSQQQVANLMETNKMWVSRKEKSATAKLYSEFV